ncbi:hypothetical protein EN00_013380 [Vibrio parahaemolyticus]|nr:hypothetical protein EN00_013380 [Vibrio parahaemolyticus]
MDNFFIALITFFSVAHLTYVFTYKEYKTPILWLFLKLDFAITIAIFLVAIIQGLSNNFSDFDLFMYVLNSCWHYFLYISLVQWFCLNISKKLSSSS